MKGIEALENNGKRNAFVFDTFNGSYSRDTIFAGYYKMVNNVLHKGICSNQLGAKNLCERRISELRGCFCKPLEEDCFDKYNPLLNIIKEACKAE